MVRRWNRKIFDQSTPCATRLQLPLKQLLRPRIGRLLFWHCGLLTCMLSKHPELSSTTNFFASQLCTGYDFLSHTCIRLRRKMAPTLFGFCSKKVFFSCLVSAKNVTKSIRLSLPPLNLTLLVLIVSNLEYLTLVQLARSPEGRLEEDYVCSGFNNTRSFRMGSVRIDNNLNAINGVLSPAA